MDIDPNASVDEIITAVETGDIAPIQTPSSQAAPGLQNAPGVQSAPGLQGNPAVPNFGLPTGNSNFKTPPQVSQYVDYSPDIPTEYNPTDFGGPGGGSGGGGDGSGGVSGGFSLNANRRPYPDAADRPDSTDRAAMDAHLSRNQGVADLSGLGDAFKAVTTGLPIDLSGRDAFGRGNERIAPEGYESFNGPQYRVNENELATGPAATRNDIIFGTDGEKAPIQFPRVAATGIDTPLPVKDQSRLTNPLGNAKEVETYAFNQAPGLTGAHDQSQIVAGVNNTVAHSYDSAMGRPMSTATRGAESSDNMGDVTQNTAVRLVNDLKRDFGLTDAQAQGAVANLAHESGGFKTMQEISPVVAGSRGGYGYAQWTGPRRVAFENYAQQNGLDINSYEANYGFLKQELQTTERRALEALKTAQTPQQATRIFEDRFERAGVVNMDSRLGWLDRISNYNYDPQVAATYDYGLTRPGGAPTYDTDIEALQNHQAEVERVANESYFGGLNSYAGGQPQGPTTDSILDEREAMRQQNGWGNYSAAKSNIPQTAGGFDSSRFGGSMSAGPSGLVSGYSEPSPFTTGAPSVRSQAENMGLYNTPVTNASYSPSSDSTGGGSSVRSYSNTTPTTFSSPSAKPTYATQASSPSYGSGKEYETYSYQVQEPIWGWDSSYKAQNPGSASFYGEEYVSPPIEPVKVITGYKTVTKTGKRPIEKKAQAQVNGGGASASAQTGPSSYQTNSPYATAATNSIISKGMALPKSAPQKSVDWGGILGQGSLGGAIKGGLQGAKLGPLGIAAGGLLGSGIAKPLAQGVMNTVSNGLGSNYTGMISGGGVPALSRGTELNSAYDVYNSTGQNTWAVANSGSIVTKDADTGWTSVTSPTSSGGSVTTVMTPTGQAATSSDKIVCTAMNEDYGFGSFRNAIWLKYAEDNLTPEHQAGYHAIFRPLLKLGREKYAWLYSALKHIARHRTADIRAEMKGAKRDTLGRIYRTILEPACYGVGWFVSTK